MQLPEKKATRYDILRNTISINEPGSFTRRTTNIHRNNNKTIVGKRNHFPMTPACAMTIHKSQGGIYDEIVYEYSKTHSIPLLCRFIASYWY